MQSHLSAASKGKVMQRALHLRLVHPGGCTNHVACNDLREMLLRGD